MSSSVRFSRVVSVAIVFLLPSLVSALPDDQELPTQGKFAVKLAEKLGYKNQQLTADSAADSVTAGNRSGVMAGPPTMAQFPATRRPPVDLSSADLTPVSGMEGAAGRVIGKVASNNVDIMIDNGVISALSAQDEVPVIVQLREPERKPDDPEKVKQLVTATQQAVLDTLSSNEFRLKHKYETIYSFSGWLTKDGLIKLQKNPNVTHIQLDGLAKPQ